jgi:hypothetical protein
VRLRLACVLWGCKTDRMYCVRCRNDLYGGAYLMRGRLSWLRQLYWRLLDRLLPRRCDVCRRWMAPRLWRERDFCCSPKCYSEWVPF